MPFWKSSPIWRRASSTSRSPAGVQQRSFTAELLSQAHIPCILRLMFSGHRTAPERHIHQLPPIFNRRDPSSERTAPQHIVLLRLSLVLRSASLQSRQPVLVSLADDAQRVLLLNLGHLVPVCDPAHCAVDVDDHGAEVVERDGRAAGAHVELRCVRGGFWES